jgi:hypothetical protein
MKIACMMLAIASLALFGCASVPVDPSGVDVSVKVMKESEVANRFGSQDAGKNPFLVPGSIFTVNKDDFIVLQFSFNSSRSADFSLYKASASDEQGKPVARLFPWDEFDQYLLDWKEDDKETADKRNVAARNYLRSLDMKIKKGQGRYIVILVGSRPFPKSMTVDVSFAVDGRARSEKLNVTR